MDVWLWPQSCIIYRSALFGYRDLVGLLPRHLTIVNSQNEGIVGIVPDGIGDRLAGFVDN